MTPLATLDDSGFRIADYPTILRHFQNAFGGIYGDDIYIEEDSQDGQMIAIFALAYLDLALLAQSVYNSFSPATAQGESLSKQVAINGIRRQAHSKSTAILRIVGSPGRTLTSAVARDANDRNWLIADVTIGISGEVTATATAEEAGDIRAAPGEISRIGTPLWGWHSVTNLAAAAPGRPIETNAALRRRQAVSTALPSKTVFDGIKGAIAAPDNVTRCKGYENDTDEIDANGLPPHSVAFVVEGGDARTIGEMIAIKKTPGCGTHGDIAINATDRYGAPITIRYFQAIKSDLAIKIVIRPLSGYLASTGEAAKKALVLAVNGLDIGDDVLISKLYTPINNADSKPRTFDVLSIEIGLKGGILAPVNLPIAFRAAASIDLADIDLVVQP